MNDCIPNTQIIQCNKCKEWLPATTDFFALNNTHKRGWQYQCKKCKSTAKPATVREGYKRCSICQKEKPATPEYFRKTKPSRNTPNGLTQPCKKCYKEKRTSLRYVWKPPEDSNQIVTKTCSKCEKEYPATPEFFMRRRTIPSGLCSWCKPCHAISTKEWSKKNRKKEYERGKKYQENNREKVRAASRKYKHANPDTGRAAKHRRRAREHSVPDIFTAEQWVNALSYWHGCCAYCGDAQGLFLDKTLCVEHFIPLSSSACPGTVAENILPVCMTCNNSKSGRDPYAWLPRKFGKREAAKILARINAYWEHVRTHHD